jgi:hypothetical protein
MPKPPQIVLVTIDTIGADHPAELRLLSEYQPRRDEFLQEVLGSRRHRLEVVADGEVGGIPAYQILNPQRDPDGRILECERDYDFYVARYDGGIRYVDACLGALLKELKELGLCDDLLLMGRRVTPQRQFPFTHPDAPHMKSFTCYRGGCGDPLTSRTRAELEQLGTRFHEEGRRHVATNPTVAATGHDDAKLETHLRALGYIG